MRKISSIQIALLIFCLCVTGALAYLRPESVALNRTPGLVRALDRVDHWQKTAVVPLDPIIVEELKLDDYVFQSYVSNAREVDLYVGYYYISGKVGAAHDPIVCFPGQGWHVSASRKHSLKFHADPAYQINYSSLIAEKNERKELVFYWYQAGSKTSAGPFMQKLLLLQSKLLNRGESNAFVRVSTTLQDETVEQGRERLAAFMRNFYPVFLDYIEES